MYYVAQLKQKEKLFNRAYRVENGRVFITNTQRSKKKFLKSGINNVIFGEEFFDDTFFSDRLSEATAYDANFCANYATNMIGEIIKRLKLSVPMKEIVVFSDDGEELIKSLCSYTRLISIIGYYGKKEFEQGVPVRYLKKMKTSPDMIICHTASPQIYDIPTIDLTKAPQRGKKNLAWDRMSFKTDLFEFDINTPALLYFLKRGDIKEFELTHIAKKCRRIFTFS